jgi:hypothetical protein
MFDRAIDAHLRTPQPSSRPPRRQSGAKSNNMSTTSPRFTGTVVKLMDDSCTSIFWRQIKYLTGKVGRLDEHENRRQIDATTNGANDHGRMQLWRFALATTPRRLALLGASFV